MTAPFSIEAEPWMVPHEGPAETKNTTAMFRITVGNRVITRVDDRWSQSTRERVVLSAYPLALWFAASWWRLIWEPVHSIGAPPPPSWRMSHEAAAAGYGYLWPRMRFASDGETVEVSSWASSHVESEPLRYLENVREHLTVLEFERAIEQFLSLVLRRLEVMGPQASQLETLWGEVQEERADEALGGRRRLEARLGFDPDEAPESLLNHIRQLGGIAGKGSSEELAAACGGRSNPGDILKQVVELATTGGVLGRMSAIPGVRVESGQVPWQRGYSLAAQVRKHLDLGDRVVTNDVLADLLGVSSKFVKDVEPEYAMPVGIAVREGGDHVRLFLRKRYPEGRRFEAARLIADGLATTSAERWLPATDAFTARQKVQRAFAAEFLAPIALLEGRLEGDFSDGAIEDAASAFGVSPLLVSSHLANNGLISPEDIGQVGTRLRGMQ